MVVDFGQIFMTLTPPHWCKTPEDIVRVLELKVGTSLSSELLRNLTIPITEEGQFEKCHRFNIDPQMVEILFII